LRRATEPPTTTKIAYAFADGHLIVASGREVASGALQSHRSGESLAKSKPLLTTLPSGQSLDASALFFSDPVAMSALQVRRFAPHISRRWAAILVEIIRLPPSTLICSTAI
jgi:hypothetical protein